MDNLLDTHTFIWFINGEEALSERSRYEIEASSNNYISIASLWEIAIKISLKKLEIKTLFIEVLNQIRANSFKILPISFEDTLTVSELPFHHKDPFDRILIAQAHNNNLQILTKDSGFNFYDTAIVW